MLYIKLFEDFDFDDDLEDEEEDDFGRQFRHRHYFTRIANNNMPIIRDFEKAQRYIRFIKNIPIGTGITNLVNLGRKRKAHLKPTTDSYAPLITWLKLNGYIDLIRTDNNRTKVIPTEKTLRLTDEEINQITYHPGA